MTKPIPASPFPGLTFAGDRDDVEGLPLEITMDEAWRGYMNQRVLNRLNELHKGRLAYLQFLPDPATGQVIIVPTPDGEAYGAMEVKYTETENGALVNLRLAVKRLNVDRLEGRVRLFPVVERPAPNGQIYLAFTVKDAESRPAVVRRVSPVDEVAASEQGPA